MVQPFSAVSRAHDFTLIGTNLQQCRASRGRWFRLLRAGDALTGFVAPRILTTALAMGAVCAVLAVLT